MELLCLARAVPVSRQTTKKPCQTSTYLGQQFAQLPPANALIVAQGMVNDQRIAPHSPLLVAAEKNRMDILEALLIPEAFNTTEEALNLLNYAETMPLTLKAPQQKAVSTRLNVLPTGNRPKVA